MNDLNIIDTICQRLGEGSPLVLATLVSRRGSAPRRTGAKMIVGADGLGHGTMGGGMLEEGLIREAGSVLLSRKTKLMFYKLDGTDMTAPGMICGGEATVLLEYVEPTEKNVEFFRSLRDIARKGEDCAYVTMYMTGNPYSITDWRFLLFRGGKVTGDCPLTAGEIELLQDRARTAGVPTNLQLEERYVLLEPVQRVKTLLCFGAGHIALPMARLAAMVGFLVTVVDDRPEMATADRFPGATVHLIDDYRHACDQLDIDEDSYVVIVTYEHLYDRVVLEGALKTNAGYIGMIASRKKRDTIYRELLDTGFNQQDLDMVHSPIGLEIGAETPEEIALSIVAEMVQVRARQHQ